jgi:hypothetical protein
VREPQSPPTVLSNEIRESVKNATNSTKEETEFNSNLKIPISPKPKPNLKDNKKKKKKFNPIHGIPLLKEQRLLTARWSVEFCQFHLTV